MGDIYAAAHLTIVAAMGNNPSHGLSGVSTNSRSVRSEGLDTLYVTVLPSSDDLTQITHSPWSTRGWTLQESVLSRRRLILTGRQAIFICNTQTCFEAGADSETVWDPFCEVGWLPLRDPSSRKSPLETATTYLVEYSKRVLSYDVDALNAIVGALNTLRKHSIYHVWGVPFGQIGDAGLEASKTTKCTGTLACDVHHGWGFPLSWGHKKAAKRRPGFPSWSPIGWVGEISMERQYQDQLLIVQPCGVKMTGLNEGQTLFSFLPSYDGLPTEISQQLQVHGETYEPLLANADGIALPFDHQFYYRFSVSWSISLALNPPRSVKALLIPGSSLHDLDDWMILLRRCEGGETKGYERIGIARSSTITKNFFINLWLDVDLQPLSYASAASRRLKASLERSYPNPEKWWRQHFTPEVVTII